MKLLVFCIAALLLAVYAALSLGLESGYVVIVRESHVIQVRLSAVIVGLCVLFGALYFLLRLVSTIRRAPQRTAQWRRRRALNNALANAQGGYADLVGGHWARAEKKLAASTRGNPAPLLSLLAAAEAANQQGAGERRDHYLEQAYEAAPEQLVTVLLARLRMQAQALQYNDAWETLARLRLEAPKNPQVRLFGVELGRRTGKWKELLQLLPGLHARGQLEPEQADEYELEATSALFRECEGKRELQAAWNELNQAQQRNPEIIAAWVGELLRHDDGTAAAPLLRRAIQSQWNPKLVLLYGHIIGDDDARYRIAEGWAEQHRDDPALLLTLGRLARRNKLWGQARSYLEAAMGAGEAGNNEETAHELGSLLEELGEKDEALQCYREALQRDAVRARALPHGHAPGPAAATHRPTARNRGHAPRHA